MKKIILLVFLISLIYTTELQSTQFLIKKSVISGITKKQENSDKKLILSHESGTPEIYLYESTLKFKDNKIYVWMSTEYYVEQDTVSVDVVDSELEITYNTIKEYYIFDTKNNLYTILYQKYINHDGITVRSEKQEEIIAKWEYIEPESFYDIVLKVLLEYNE